MKFSEAAKKVIGAIAPTIGAAIGGPFGPLAGKILGGLLGGDEKKVEDAVLSGDPTALAQVRVAETEFNTRLEELGVDREKLANEDRADARKRQVDLKDHTPAVLAYLITAGLFGCIAYLIKNGTPQEGGEALLLLLGSLGTAWIAVVTFYFGSSSSSRAKDETLSHIAKMP